MTARARLWLIALGVLCGGYGLAAIIIYAIYFTRHPWQDWMVYHAAARAWLDGNLPLVFDGARFAAHLNRRFSAWLSEPFGFRSFMYPPPFLLLLIPFGLLGFAASCLLFESLTCAGLLAALWQCADDFRRRALYALSLVLAPAAGFNLAVGQNGFLTGALLVGGFGVLPRRPAMAGVLLGLLAYKPQFWPLAPLALAAAREWRALAFCISTAAAMALASLAVLGSVPWLLWIAAALRPPPGDYRSFLVCCRLHDESVFTNLTLLGAPTLLADLGQLAAILLAAGVVWWCHRHRLRRELRLAVLLAASFLAAPHAANYDAVLLVVAATAVVANGLERGFRPGGVIVPVLVWMIQLFNPPDAFALGLATPLLTVLLIACAVDRARHGAAPIGARPGAAFRLFGAR